MNQDKETEIMSKFINTALDKGYSQESIRIIGAIVCSNHAEEKGCTLEKGFELAIEYCLKYDNEKECINNLVNYFL